jgi:sigma-B regulation protein RsbU (phosphoserine phosphatase)
MIAHDRRDDNIGLPKPAPGRSGPLSARSIVLSGLAPAEEHALRRHAAALGIVVAADGHAPAAHRVIVYPIDGHAPETDSPAIAIGMQIDPHRQALALQRGATDIVDLSWSPELIATRLRQIFVHEELRARVAARFAAQDRDLADARAMQLALLPPPLAEEGLAIDAVLEPALELGGDLVDYIRINDGRIVLALGDVSGKGAAAALTMARTHTLLRSLALRTYAADIFAPPDNAARRLNGMLAIDNDGCIFVTMFLGLFDPATGELDYIRCGQIPPFLRRAAGGPVERLDAVGGLPLGVFEEATYEVGRVVLARGDTLLVVSDGVTEAEAPDGTLMDEAPVIEWLAVQRDDMASLVALTRAHEQGGDPSDDLSALLLRFR